MSIAKEALSTELDYSAWATQQLLDSCSSLTAEELDRDLGASHRTITGTLRHIYYAERVWLKRLRADSLPPMSEVGDQELFKDSPPEPRLEALKQNWPEVWKGLRQWLDNHSEEELNDQLCSRLSNGNEFYVSRWKVVLHMVNHSTLHRGQVMGMLRSLGKQPPGTDLFAYYLK
ncbi:MAG: DinB family protein [Candidatus Acidiferrales bacterium]